MAYSTRTSENVETGNFLRAPGWYHFAITAIEENPTGSDGSLLDGFKVHLQVLNGTVQAGGVCSEIGKATDIMFFEPKLSQKNEGEFARKKITRFLLSSNLIKQDDLGKDIEVELAGAVGQQVVAKLEPNEKNEKYLELHYADIFHVDDPAVKDIPKCARSLSLISPKHRIVGGKPATETADGSSAKDGKGGKSSKGKGKAKAAESTQAKANGSPSSGNGAAAVVDAGTEAGAATMDAAPTLDDL